MKAGLSQQHMLQRVITTRLGTWQTESVGDTYKLNLRFKAFNFLCHVAL